MKYFDVKAKLLSLFDTQKLEGKIDDEWGFINEADKDIHKIGYATSLSVDVVNEAVRNDVDFILTHHDAWDFVYGMKEKCKELLYKHNIIHAFFHEPLDFADFGTCFSLADALGLQNCRNEIVDSCLVMGETKEPVVFELFKDELSNVLQESIRAYQNNINPVRKVCVATGAGNLSSDIKIAVECKCDTYVTGEYNLYSQMYAKLSGINLLVGSHTNTEIIGVQQMVLRLVDDTNIKFLRIPENNY